VVAREIIAKADEIADNLFGIVAPATEYFFHAREIKVFRPLSI